MTNNIGAFTIRSISIKNVPNLPTLVECTENPLFKTNPKAFRDRREQELGRR